MCVRECAGSEREREESVTDRERISEKEGCAWLAGLLTQRREKNGGSCCLLAAVEGGTEKSAAGCMAQERKNK